jgi:site-specific DNA-methyltransferase (adenine-specific)
MKLLLGDCLDKLKELEDNSVDSIVTDPPYELGFMGKGWDSSGIAFNTQVWTECLRVLKPGGHLLAFGGTRTYHRMTVAIEDSGFEIRDCIFWCYGQGFPKSMDISKQIDKKLGAQREVIGIYDPRSKFDGSNREDREIGGQQVSPSKTSKLQITTPATDLAKQWSGWGTALKPAVEPVVMARKPLSEPTVADNVLKWGTGGINIDESRIDLKGGENLNKLSREGKGDSDDAKGMGAYGQGARQISIGTKTVEGRFPANIIFDEEAGKLLDEQSGISRSGVVKNDKGAYEGTSNTGFLRGVSNKSNQHGDIGGASRFFYCPKVSKSERNEGLGAFPVKQASSMPGRRTAEDMSEYKIDNDVTGRFVTLKQNIHPTVKPVDLMLYLIRMVTPKGGTTLDPFMGSGSSGKAAVRGGFDFIGIEREEEYFQIAEARIEYEKNKPKGNVKTKTPKKETQETISKFFE